jgi:membrane protease subunit HflK
MAASINQSNFNTGDNNMAVYRDNEPPFDAQLAEQFERAGTWLRRMMPKLAPIVLGLVVVVWLASGIYIVGPGERGVVRTFGKMTAMTDPGLRYHFPYPFQQRDVVSVERIHRTEIGVDRGRRVLAESLMLTGDENIVDAQMVVQYRITDPFKYLFRLDNPHAVLHAATQVALRSTVGNMTIDQVMIEQRTRVQDETRLFVQRLMDEYQSGLIVTEVTLQAADPPDRVRDAFHDVVRAREDRERLINQALGYQADIVPRARGAAQQILREAEAYREQRVLRAQGDAARFLSVLAEYRPAPEVTRQRLYLETVEKVLPEIEKVIVDDVLGQRTIPLLPLGAMPPGIAPVRTPTEPAKGR